MQVKYREERKYIINQLEYAELQRVLRAVMRYDAHAREGGYNIRSLYLDDLYHTAYQEKMDGVEMRKKYRVRVYNCSPEQIALECKHKNGSFIYKESVSMSLEEYRRFKSLDYGFLLRRTHPMAREFYVDARTNLVCPCVIVEYDREPFVNDVGTVRITFDKNLNAIPPTEDIFDPQAVSRPVLPPGQMILEVKFTGILPEHIRSVLKSFSFGQTSASKFCMCVDKLNGLLP